MTRFETQLKQMGLTKESYLQITPEEFNKLYFEHRNKDKVRKRLFKKRKQ